MQYDSYNAPRVDIGGPLYEFPIAADLGLVGGQILPEHNVGEEAGNFTAFIRENMRIPDTLHADGTGSARGVSKAEDSNYATLEYWYEETLTKKKRKRYMNDFDASLATARFAMVKAEMAREKRIADAVFNTTTWTGSDLFTTIGTNWSDAGADIIGDVQAANEKVENFSGMMPNALYLSRINRKYFVKNTAIKDAVKYTSLFDFEAMDSAIAGLLDLERIIWTGGVYNSANQGAAYASARIWSSSYAAVGVLARGPEMDLEESPHLGRTMKWSEMGPNVINVDTYFEDQTKSEVHRVTSNVQEKIFDPYTQHLMKID